MDMRVCFTVIETDYLLIYLSILFWSHQRGGGGYNEVVNVSDFTIVVKEFELQSRYQMHFRTNAPRGKAWNPLSSLAMSLIRRLRFFCWDGCGIE